MIKDLHMVQNGYSLDYSRVLKVQNLEFKDSFSSLKLIQEKYQTLSMEEIYLVITVTMTSLDSATNKGFLTTHDLSKFPIISDLLPSFTHGESEVSLTGEESKESYK
jgi:hypothetical protein